jgi:hypothetical protein
MKFAPLIRSSARTRDQEPGRKFDPECLCGSEIDGRAYLVILDAERLTDFGGRAICPRRY